MLIASPFPRPPDFWGVFLVWWSQATVPIPPITPDQEPTLGRAAFRLGTAVITARTGSRSVLTWGLWQEKEMKNEPSTASDLQNW